MGERPFQLLLEVVLLAMMVRNLQGTHWLRNVTAGGTLDGTQLLDAVSFCQYTIGTYFVLDLGMRNL